MHTLLTAILLTGTVLSAQSADPVRSESSTERAEPCYVVIAVDVSGSMERSDKATADGTGRERTLRDEGQLIFMQLLPFLRSDVYLCVAHFSDRVRYALPSSETGTLLPWGQAYLSESAYRNMVRPAEFQGTFHTDVAESMAWAARRIQAARQEYGDGTAKLILLSHGDPYDSARELNRGSGPVLEAAKRLADREIEIYPVLINSASFSEGEGRLSSRELAAEDLMHSVASMTGGSAYRLAEDTGFADILMDVFDLGTHVREDLTVSRHDWAVVMVGQPFASITVQPPTGVGGSESLELAAQGGQEAAPGISTSVIPSRHHQACVIRRPETAKMVERSWQGRWQIQWPEIDGRPAFRIYRIPAFLVQVEATPELPWWRHEKVQLRTRLLDRHKKVPGLELPNEGAKQSLSVRIAANPAVGTNSFLLEEGRWLVPGRSYQTEPFTVSAPGLYEVACELRDRVGDVDVPILHAARDVYVHSECVGLQVVNADDEVLQTVPPDGAEVPIDARGGQQIYFRTQPKGEFDIELLSGTLHLEPLSRTEWPLREDAEGNLITRPVPLVEREQRLTGWAEIDVRTFAGVRRFRLPTFELAYAPAPLRIECEFADARETLWVGEFHKQPLTISAFPVFEPSLKETVKLFPEALAEARIRTVDMRSGTTQAMGPASRLLEPPRPEGYEGRTVEATYFVESANPIPPSDKCEIDLRGVMKDLDGAVRTYSVVDPVAEGLFTWTVDQDGSDEPQPQVAETLYCGEPVRFAAEWRPDQNVSAVRFEVPHEQTGESHFVDVPVEGGATSATVEQVLPGLAEGQNRPVYVHVTMQPPGATQPVEVTLQAGRFRAEDRRLVLDDLNVGGETPTDISARAWEPVELPLEAVFGGYLSGNPRHAAAVEQFKKGCRVTVMSRASQVTEQDVTPSIEWLEVQVDEPARRCTLRGRAVYTPPVAGRATVELVAEAPMTRGTADTPLRKAFAHLMAKEPRVAVTVHRLMPAGQEPVFDSRQWVGGDGGLTTLNTRLATQLRMSVESDGWNESLSSPVRMSVRLLRRATAGTEWLPVFSDEVEVAAGEPVAREVQVVEPGEYAIELVGHDPQSGDRRLYFQTPVVTSVRKHDIEPVVAPPTWLTSRVRQWPFEFQVTLYQDAARLGQVESVAFQFRLPGRDGKWFDGAAVPVESDTPDAKRLSVRAPQLMPPIGDLADGTAEFRLASQGLEFMKWDYPNIRVIPPVLEGLATSRRVVGPASNVAGATLTFDGTTDLWVRPVFRTAPELEEQWAPSEMTVYLWSAGDGPADAASAGSQAEVRLLEGLRGGGEPLSNVQSFRVEDVIAGGAKVLAERAGRRFWGWPKPATSERYSLVASVAYRPVQTDGAEGPTDRVVTEWSDIYRIDLETAWVVPLCWWPIAALLVLLLVMAVLRLLVPSPGRLGLDMRLEENIAVVEPVRFDNPVLVDLRETPLAREMRLRRRYLSCRWGARGPSGAGKPLVSALAALVAAGGVILRRALYPRRWAWAAIMPRIRGDARQVHTELLCVWTGLGARTGRAWSSQSGQVELPRDGEIRTIDLELPYRVEDVDRTMRVTVRIRRTASKEVEAVPPGWQEGTDFESEASRSGESIEIR